MRLIDADDLNCRLATLDQLCKTDNMKALLGRVLFVVDKMPTVVEREKVKPIEDGDDQYVCEQCGEVICWEELDVSGIVPFRQKYCSGCGRLVEWDD